jgi:hypothetical protein
MMRLSNTQSRLLRGDRDSGDLYALIFASADGLGHIYKSGIRRKTDDALGERSAQPLVEEHEEQRDFPLR